MFNVDKENVYNLLKKLCDTIGPSGFEDDIRNIVIEELKPYADKLWVDALGNVVALKKGSRGSSRLMFAAHMDEIGLIVRYIDDRGFLRFQAIGGVNARVLPGQRVLVKTSKGTVVEGVIGVKPPHIMKPDEVKQVMDIKDMFIDIGVSSREEAEELGVRVGSVVVFDRKLVRMGNSDYVTGKSLDDRVGLAAMIEAFKLIDNNEVDIYAVATVQEEVGLKGARVAAFSISPHAAIALDVTIASDVAGVPEPDWICRLGKGPAIKIVDGRNASGLIAHPKIRDKLVEVAEKHKIPYQLEVLPGGTTDASIIALNKEGVPATTVSIPSRYIHSPAEIVHLEDVVNTIKLIAAFATDMKDEWLKQIIRKEIK